MKDKQIRERLIILDWPTDQLTLGGYMYVYMSVQNFSLIWFFGTKEVDFAGNW